MFNLGGDKLRVVELHPSSLGFFTLLRTLDVS